MKQYGIKDKDGKIELHDYEFAVDEEYKNLEIVTKKAKVNPQEVLNKENYIKSQDILLDKFRRVGITDYNVNRNKETR